VAATVEELEELERAIRLGALSVRYGDRTLTYRSLAEMRSIRDELKAELGTADPDRRRVWTFNRGT
jgi:hypothetical protein